MPYTQEELSEIAQIIGHIVTLTAILTSEGKVPVGDRLITAGNITKINNNIGELSDYLETLVPPAV